MTVRYRTVGDMTCTGAVESDSPRSGRRDRSRRPPRASPSVAPPEPTTRSPRRRWKIASARATSNGDRGNAREVTARNMDLLRFSTAGSVDDGKSTLIGRLLYDSKGIFEDQLAAIERTSRRRGDAQVDLALLTDGLRAEREQGITIDVAYRYFATPRRKFIIADTPGHVQYTRNMVTGASTADLAIVLVDARKGVLEQSRRHAFIAALLGIPHIVVAVNKMDLVDWSEERLRARSATSSRRGRPSSTSTTSPFIPISALHGDNVVDTLDQHALVPGPVAAVPPRARPHRLGPQPASTPASRSSGSCRPQTDEHHDYRGYAGQSRPAPSGRATRWSCCRRGTQTRSSSIDIFDGQVDEAVAADVRDHPARGRHRHLPRRHDLPAAQPADGRPRTSTRWSAGWPTRHSSAAGATAQAHDALRHGVRRRLCATASTSTRFTATRTPTASRSTRSAGSSCARARRCCSTSTAATGTTGAFILIDETTNDTVGAGMVVAPTAGAAA